MARHSKRGKKSDQPPKPRTDSRNNASGGNYNVVEQTNAKMEAYYKAQNIVPESEWEDLLAAFRRPLPTTFRLTTSRPTAEALNKHIEKVYVPMMTGIQHEGVDLAAPKPLQWHPGQLAWQLPLQKSALRKIDAFKKFQHFLVYETDAGNISRQEAVSMIPPLLLDVKPGHTALDMCAAPGSKSVQILEDLHGPPTDGKEGASKVPQGLLIANDSDAKRCHLLVHQSLHRVPGTGMMVTNHDATQLPSLRLPKSANNTLRFTNDDERKVNKLTKADFEKKFEPMLFDRILADVPCSGDGTLRKNMGIWGDWTVGNGIGLHSLQLRILLRGIQLLKPGGRLVYSTCSMNPMENEAVVSAALAECPDMSILPVSEELPGLIRRPGLTTWKVLDNSLADAPHPSTSAESTLAGTPEEDIEVESTETSTKSKGKESHPNNQDKKGARKTWLASLWPPAEEVAKQQGLEHSLRLYPHLQDTGAFYVCVLVKKGGETETETKKEVAEEKSEAKRERASSPVEGEPETKKLRAEEGAAVAPEVAKEATEVVKASEPEAGKEKMGAGRPFNEEPYIYLTGLEDEQVKICKEFFDISDSFPFDCLLVRNAAGAALRSIYLTSKLTKSILSSNAYTRMRLISCGVKLFTRQDSSKDGTYVCKWRINSEGLEVIRPYLGEKRIVNAGQSQLRQLMENVSVKFEDLQDEDLRKQVTSLEAGSAVLRIQGAKGADTEAEEDLYLAFWISKVSVNLMVEKVEKSALSLRLYSEDCTPHARGKPPPTGPGTAAHSRPDRKDEKTAEVVSEKPEEVAVAKEETGEAAVAAEE
ncbi:hypothetical protein JCM5350_000471 [Sporobolomyces pararoseus]